MSQPRNRRILDLVDKIASALSVIMFAVLLYDMYRTGTGQSLITSVVAYAALHAPILVKVVAITLIFALFSFRGYIPLGYGSLEIAVGILIILSTPDIAQPTIPAIIPLLTGAYVGVRGLDNIAKGLKKGGRPAKVFETLFNQPPKEQKKGA